MKHNHWSKMISVLLALVMVIGLIPGTALTALAAANISGTVNASKLSANGALNLTGDTTIVMDKDLTLSSISGEDYNLTVQGSGKLTVNGSGNGIAVKSLTCSSDLFIQTGWHAIEVTDTVYIDNAESFIVGGIYAAGHIDIRCNNATIGGNGNAIASSLGSITLSGGTFDIGANGIAVAAETGGIYMTGAFTVNSNNDRTIHAAKGELVINGSLKSVSGAQFDPDVHFINRDSYSIGATGGFNFYGTTLEVTGLGGIRGGGINIDADISITADSVSIITERYYALNGGNIYVDSDNLWIENRGSEENENVPYTFHTIFADGDATLYSENGGIVGENCFFVDGNLTLNGNFVVGADHDSGYAMRSIGRTEVNGNLRVIAEDISCVYAEKGFSFNGSTLKLEGYHGIMVQNGDVNIVADSTEIVVSDDCAIQDATEKDSVCNVYIDSDYLWLQGGKDEVHNSGCVDVRGNVTIYSDEATIMGNYGIDASGDIVLDGNFVVLGLLQEAIRSESRVEARGKLSLATEGEYHCLTAEEFVFDGSTLVADGYAGIWGRVTEINADSVAITTKVGATLDGDEVYVIANYLWAENKATKAGDGTRYGITANSKLALTVKGGTVIGYDDALHVYDENDQFEFHYIYVNGHLTAVSQTGVGMYAPQGTVELYGGPIVSVGESHGIDAKDVVFEGGSLRVEGDTGIHAISSVKLTGEDVRITAFNERRSGIWVENGYVDLKGKVVIETNGWYGINADTHVAFEEGYYQIIGPKNDAQAVKAGGFLYLDGTLEIIQPDGGHVNGNNIYGAGDSPAMEVTIFSALDEVSLYITAPSEGNRPTWDASGIYYLDPRCTVEKIVWYENGEEMSGDAVFKAGKSYSVQLILSADGDYYFVDDMVGKINGNPVFTGISANKLMLLEADMGTCASTIGIVGLTIDAPEQYTSPDQSVVCTNSAYKQALAGDNMFDAPVQWQKSTDGKNWTIMNLNETFTVGNYYRVYIDIMPAAGYEFDLDSQLDPNVIATVNGYPALVSRYPEADPSTLISVCYDFGQLNDTVIEQIDIDGVVEPVVGEKPSYTCAISGSGYTVNTAYDNGTYAINGMCWYDVTDDMWVRPNHTFQIGHQYKVFVDVKTESGYEFYTTHVGSSYKPAGWGYINGNYATFGIQSDARFEQSLSWTFTCQPKTVKAVAVMDLDVPADGFTPDFDAVTDSDYYTVESIVWTDYTAGIDMTEDDTFVAGNEYWVMITVVPKEEEGNKLCEFLSNNKTTATLNGIEVKDLPDDSWQEVTSSPKRVVIFYTFKKASAAGDNNFLTGTVTSFHDAAGEITLQLIPQGLPEVAYEITVRGNTVDYYFAGVAAGTYTLKVSKKNHVTREYTVTVNGSHVTQDVKIHMIGDIDGNGKVNVGDVAKINGHIKGTNQLTDDYQLLCANINGGKLNMGDTAALYAHIKGTKLLY